MLREFVARKVTLIIPSAGIDTSKMPGKVFLDTLDAISEFKHSVARRAYPCGTERCEKAWESSLGRPTTVNAHREDVARLRAQGRTGRSIAKELGHAEFDCVQDYWPARRCCVTLAGIWRWAWAPTKTRIPFQ